MVGSRAISSASASSVACMKVISFTPDPWVARNSWVARPESSKGVAEGATGRARLPPSRKAASDE